MSGDVFRWLGEGETRFQGEREVLQTFTVAPVLENEPLDLRFICFFIIIVNVNIIPGRWRLDLQRLVSLQIPQGQLMSYLQIPPGLFWTDGKCNMMQSIP